MGLTYVPVIKNNADVTFKSLIVSGTSTLTGDVAMGGNLSVAGASTFNGNVTFNTGTVTLNNGLTVFGTSTLGTVLMSNATATQVEVTTGTGTTTALGAKTTGDTQDRTLIQGNGTIALGSGSAAADTTIVRTGVNALQMDNFVRVKSFQSDGDAAFFGTSVALGTVGGILKVKSGANATIGTATLTAGSVTVNTTKVTATSVIFLTVQAIGTVSTPKAMTILNKTAGTSFQIVSSDATDTSTVAWWIVETA